MTDQTYTAVVAARGRQAVGVWRATLDAVTASRNGWMAMAFVQVPVILALTVGLIWSHQKVRIIPFIDVVDPQNRVLWSGPAGSYQVDDVWVIEALTEWVIDVRSRPGNLKRPYAVDVLNARWKAAYARTDGTAARTLAAYIQEESPLKQKEPVEVEVTIEFVSRYHKTALPPDEGQQNCPEGATCKAYHIEWVEEWKAGARATQRSFSGDFWTEVRPDARKGMTEQLTQREVDRKKPGLYITYFRIDPKLRGLSADLKGNL